VFEDSFETKESTKMHSEMKEIMEGVSVWSKEIMQSEMSAQGN